MSARAVIRVGLCGLGTVGQGVWKHLHRRSGELEATLGARLEIARVAVRDLSRRRSVRVPAARLTDDPMAVAVDPTLPIVCELMGGTGIARRVTLAALERGKIVISANKALLCEHGDEILAAARRHGGRILFEASVAGAIPIVKALREGLVANRFPRIHGILNGTCNYILTEMATEGAPYGRVLAEAKRLGYAEADESLDVEGWDTAHKAAVLAWLAHGVWVRPDRMIVEGITRLAPADFANAKSLGYAIKLLAVIERDYDRDELSVRVHPTLLPAGGVLASVSGVRNAVSVAGDVAGTTLYIGRGAGQDATASAVLSDLADAVRILRSGGGETDSVGPRPAGGCRLAPLSRLRCRYYLRLTVVDRPGVLARVAAAMARRRVSIATVLQLPADRPGAASLVLTTHATDEHAFRSTLHAVARLGSVLEEPLVLRIGDFAD